MQQFRATFPCFKIFLALICGLTFVFNQIEAQANTPATPERNSFIKSVISIPSSSELYPLPLALQAEELDRREKPDYQVYSIPESEPGYLTLHRAYELAVAGHYEEAVTEYKKVPEFFRRPSQFRLSETRAFGTSLEMTGHYSEALQVYERTDQTDLRCILLLRLGKYGEALEVIQQNLKPQDKYAFFSNHRMHHKTCVWKHWKAIAEAGLGNDRAAIMDLKEALKEYRNWKPELATTCVLEANKLIERSKIGEPLKVPPSTTPESNDRETFSPENLANWRKQKAQASLNLCTEKLQSEKNLPGLYKEKSFALLSLGRPTEALSEIERAYEIGGKPFLYDRALIEVALGQNEESIKDLASCISGHSPGPETKEIFLEMSKILLKMGHFDKAKRAANDAMMDCREKARANFLIAQAELELGHNSESRKYAELSIQESYLRGWITMRDKVRSWMKDNRQLPNLGQSK